MICKALVWGNYQPEESVWDIVECGKPAVEYVKVHKQTHNIRQRYVLCRECVEELGLLNRGFRRVDEVPLM